MRLPRRLTRKLLPRRPTDRAGGLGRRRSRFLGNGLHGASARTWTHRHQCRGRDRVDHLAARLAETFRAGLSPRRTPQARRAVAERALLGDSRWRCRAGPRSARPATDLPQSDGDVDVVPTTGSTLRRAPRWARGSTYRDVRACRPRSVRKRLLTPHGGRLRSPDPAAVRIRHRQQRAGAQASETSPGLCSLDGLQPTSLPTGVMIE